MCVRFDDFVMHCCSSYPQYCVLSAAPQKLFADKKSHDKTMYLFRQSLTEALPIIFGVPFNTNHVVDQVFI